MSHPRSGGDHPHQSQGREKKQKTEHNHDQQHSNTTNTTSILYRHALESIFKFCSLRELHSIISVSRSWLSAVCSMRSVGAASAYYRYVMLSTLVQENVFSSRLSRHIGGQVSRADFERPPGKWTRPSLNLFSNSLTFDCRILYIQCTSLRFQTILPVSHSELSPHSSLFCTLTPLCARSVCTWVAV